MISSIRSPFLSVVIGLLLAVSAAGQETPGPAELAGSYYSGHRFGGSAITLNEDGTYSDRSGSCTFTTAESATFVVSDGAVRFKILKYTGKSHSNGLEVDLFDNQARREFSVTAARIRVGRETKVGDKLTTKFKRKDIYR